MMQSVPPCPAPAHWRLMQVSRLLLHWQSHIGTYSVVFCFSLSYIALWDSKTPHRLTCGSISYCVETSPPSCLPPQDRSPSLVFFSAFLSFIFVLPPFEENGLPFWVSGVLCQHSEVVLWKLLNIQMSFWWMCLGESGLSVLFLHHLGTTSLNASSTYSFSNLQWVYQDEPTVSQEGSVYDFNLK